MRFYLYAYLVFLFLPTIVLSQNSFENDSQYKIYSNTFINAGNAPTWLRTNQNGTVDLQGNFQQIGFGVKNEYLSKLKKMSISYALEPVINIGKVNKVRLKEAYAALNWKHFELFAGRKVQNWGLVDTLNSSSSIALNQNALPLPMVQFGTKGFIPILGKGFFSINFLGGHGWFGKETFTEKYYLHYKSFFGRFGRDSQKINLTAGINNYIQWGGYSETLKNNPGVTQNGQIPDDLNTFIGLVLPFPAVRAKFPPKIDLVNDNNNYLGNVAGSVDFSFQFKNENVKLLAYRQIPFDLGSLFTSFINADDGLYGLSISSTQDKIFPFGIKNITLESFHSKNQGTYFSQLKRLIYNKPHSADIHNYYNHGQYLDGWSYKNKALGTPFIFNNEDLDKSKFNETFENYSNYNWNRAFYLNINAYANGFDYGTKISYWPYIGVQKTNSNKKQFAAMVMIGKAIKNEYHASISAGYDIGDMYKNSFGLNLRLQKSFNYSPKPTHLHQY